MIFNYYICVLAGSFLIKPVLFDAVDLQHCDTKRHYFSLNERANLSTETLLDTKHDRLNARYQEMRQGIDTLKKKQ